MRSAKTVGWPGLAQRNGATTDGVVIRLEIAAIHEVLRARPQHALTGKLCFPTQSIIVYDRIYISYDCFGDWTVQKYANKYSII